MRKPRLIPPIRLPLFVAVFVVGLGIGAAAIAVSHKRHAGHMTVTRTVVSSGSPARSSRSPTPSAASGHTTTADSQPSLKGAHSGPRIAHARAASAPPAHAVSSSFAGLQAQLGGSVGLAVAPLGAGPIQTFGRVQTAHAWSTSKVPVLVTLLATEKQRGRELSADDRDNATLALTESDNAAVEALFSSLEQLRGGLVPASEAIEGMFRRAGDQTAVVNTAPNDEGFTTYGQSEWSLRDEIIFYRALARGCLVDSTDTDYVLGLMRDVIPSQRWGAGSAGYPSSADVKFKGGWGPVDGAYQVRQTAIIGSGNQGYTMSMIALPASGSFTDGTNMLTAIAAWARQHFDVGARQPTVGCASGD
jgi:hypothetical protein